MLCDLPGGPAIIMFGTFPSLAKMANLETVSSFPTISLNAFGRYFSIHGTARGFFDGFVVPFFSGSTSIVIS